MAILSFLQDDAFIFVITLATKQRLESQIEAGIRGKHHPGLNSNFSFFVQRCHFACRKFNLLAIDGKV